MIIIWLPQQNASAETGQAAHDVKRGSKPTGMAQWHLSHPILRGTYEQMADCLKQGLRRTPDTWYDTHHPQRCMHEQPSEILTCLLLCGGYPQERAVRSAARFARAMPACRAVSAARI